MQIHLSDTSILSDKGPSLSCMGHLAGRADTFTGGNLHLALRRMGKAKNSSCVYIFSVAFNSK